MKSAASVLKCKCKIAGTCITGPDLGPWQAYFSTETPLNLYSFLQIYLLPGIFVPISIKLSLTVTTLYEKYQLNGQKLLEIV